MDTKEVKMTALRGDILAIVRASKKPLGAYDILNKLKKKRPNAEPPTVYRVLEYLQAVKLVHRIDSKNLYVSCSHPQDEVDEHKSLLLFCNDCHLSFEYQDAQLSQFLIKFAKQKKLKLDDSVIEIKGHCPDCHR